MPHMMFLLFQAENSAASAGKADLDSGAESFTFFIVLLHANGFADCFFLPVLRFMIHPFQFDVFTGITGSMQSG